MDDQVMFYSSTTRSFFIVSSVLASIYALIFLYSTFLLIKTLFTPKIAQTSMVQLFLALVMFQFFCNPHTGAILVLFSEHFFMSNQMKLSFGSMPCACFTAVLSRIVYQLIYLILEFSTESDLEKIKSTMHCIKIALFAYVFINYTSRIIVALIGNNPNFINGSCRQTLAMLSISFTFTSFLMVCISFWFLQKKFNTIFTNDQGETIKRNIKNFTGALIFMITIYWTASIMGITCFTMEEDHIR